MGELADALSIGHRPRAQLVPQDETLFRAFQANLLSLISHELRTPLTGVMNSLNMLDSMGALRTPDGVDMGMAPQELVAMAKRNAQRLNQTLITLLDLASLESGTFHVQLRELDLGRILQNRLEVDRQWARDAGVKFDLKIEGESLILGDPTKVTRAVDLCLNVIGAYIDSSASMKIRVRPGEVCFFVPLKADRKEPWKDLWSQSVAGFASGVTSPASAFGGVLQSEQAFLTRTEEGLGSELLLIHQILRLHEGKFISKLHDQTLELVFEFPKVSSVDALKAVLKSRAFNVTSEIGTVALVLIQVPKGRDPKKFCVEIKHNLFRSTDAAYSLDERAQVALVLDDCKLADVDIVTKRLERTLGLQFAFGFGHCPSDGLDPGQLLDIADYRFAENQTPTGGKAQE